MTRILMALIALSISSVSCYASMNCRYNEKCVKNIEFLAGKLQNQSSPAAEKMGFMARSLRRHLNVCSLYNKKWLPSEIDDDAITDLDIKIRDSIRTDIVNISREAASAMFTGCPGLSYEGDVGE